MNVVIGVELVLALLLAVAFVGLYWRSHWESSPMGRHVMAFTAVTAVEALLLLLLLFGVGVPVEMFVVLFGAVDLVLGQRIWLLVRAQRQVPPG